MAAAAAAEQVSVMKVVVGVGSPSVLPAPRWGEKSAMLTILSELGCDVIAGACILCAPSGRWKIMKGKVCGGGNFFIRFFLFS